MMSEEAQDNFYRRTVWTKYIIAFLGVWLIAVACAFNYNSSWLWWSDFLAGSALVASGIYALTGHHEFTPWDSSAIGLWLLVAPVLLWAPDPFVYLNDTAIGVLALAFGSLIPGVPEDVLRQGDKAPPGWSYNPSSWMQRLPVIAFAILGWVVSVYMAGYQLGYRDDADFLFGRGTTKVLESGLLGSFPMADAGLEAVVFLLIAALACLGSARRWHAMPWAVVLFGGVAVLLGVSNAFYTLLQPLSIGYWCGWCLLTALCALAIVVLAIDEVIAVCVYLNVVRQTGKPVGQVFWQGDGGGGNERGAADAEDMETFSPAEMFRGTRVNGTRVLCVFISTLVLWGGHWFGIGSTAAAAVHVVAALMFIVAALTLAEVLCALRYVNVLLAAVLVGYVWTAPGLPAGAAWFYTACEGGIIALSLLKGRKQESYGAADKWIF